MNAGKMDRRVTIQQYTATRDAYGGETETWAEVATVWAEVRPKSGREYFHGDQVNAEVDTLMFIRWRSGITNKMRVNYNSVYYDIVSIREIGRREGLELTLKAKVD